MEREVNFATMVSTGEKPDVEIHIAGFDSEEALATTNSIAGHGSHLAMAIGALVGDFCKSLRENDSDDACAAFVHIVMDKIASNTTEEIARKAQRMAMLKQLAGAAEAVMNSDDFKEFLKSLDDAKSDEEAEEGAEEE